MNKTRFRRFHRQREGHCLLLASMLAVFAGCSCAPVIAQGSGQNTENARAQADKRVSIDAEDATLASVLTTLMNGVGANYTLDGSLRALRVTAHLHDLRLTVALDVLLRSVATPVMYRLEDGVYQFQLKTEPALMEPEAPRAASDTPARSSVHRLQVARVNFIDAAEAALILGGIPIRTNGQTYGLVDPNKLGIVGVSSGGTGAAGNAGAGQPGANGQSTSGQNTTLPANVFDYLWIVNAGAGF